MILSTNLSNSDGQRPEVLVNAKPHSEISKNFKSEPMPKNHRNPENTIKFNKMHRFSVAPMLDWTDRHCRFFHRLISQHALLYTEMVTTGALIHGDHHRFLQFNAAESPLAFQLGGSNPHDLAICARMVEDYGYDEVNLNVGCPSDRVQNGRFGACLMAEPELVAECVAAMSRAVVNTGYR